MTEIEILRAERDRALALILAAVPIIERAPATDGGQNWLRQVGGVLMVPPTLRSGGLPNIPNKAEPLPQRELDRIKALERAVEAARGAMLFLHQVPEIAHHPLEEDLREALKAYDQLVKEPASVEGEK